MPSNNFNRLRIKKITAYSLLFLAMSFLLIVIYFLFSSYGIELLNFSSDNSESGLITIKDECSILAGQLLHTINIEDECSLKCRSQCEVLDKRYDKAEFSFGNNSCNSCNCFCK